MPPRLYCDMTSQRILSVSSREFDPSDYERLVQILNANYPDYAVSVAEQRSRDESIDKSKYVYQRLTFSDEETGRIVGFGGVSHVLDMFHPRRYMISIYVDPNEQGRGVGSAIYQRLSSQLEALGAEVVWASNKEDYPRQRQFFQKRGFREKSRAWESRLVLATFDPSHFQPYIAKVSREGISFTTLAHEKEKGESFLRPLYELVQLIQADMPREAAFTPLSYEQWKSLSIDSPRLIPEGYVIAKHDSTLVGMSNVLRNEKEPRNLSQDDTGVIRDYRGRGIAMALKLNVIEFARKNGYDSIKTWNDSTNSPMLAVNSKLGFKRKVGWILMERPLIRNGTP